MKTRTPHSFLAACAMALISAAMPAAPPTATSGKTQWPLLENGQVKVGSLAVDAQGTLACLYCDASTPSTDPNTPPTHKGGPMMLDLVKGDLTEAAPLLKDVIDKGMTLGRLIPSPAGDSLAAVVWKADGREVKYTWFLIDRKTMKPTKLIEGEALWSGKNLLVSRETADGIDSIEKFGSSRNTGEQ